MDLAELIERQRTVTGLSLRAMSQRAADAGHPISHAAIDEYAKGKTRTLPGEDKRRALAAALDVTVAEVNAAALETAAPDIRMTWPDGFTRASAFLHLTENRSAAEIEHVLAVVRTVLQGYDLRLGMLDADRNSPRTDDHVVTGAQPDTSSDRESR